MSDKSLFATFARTKPHDSQISMAVVSLLLTFNWTTIAFVYSDEERLLADALLEVHTTRVQTRSLCYKNNKTVFVAGATERCYWC